MHSDSSGILSKYPFLRDAALDGARILEEARKRYPVHAPTTARVGVQFGSISGENGNFTPGVSRRTFDVVASLLCSYDGWHSSADWEECVDVFYVLPDGTKICTTIDYNSPNQDPVRHTEKFFSTRRNYKTVQLDTQEAPNPTPIDSDISLYVEEDTEVEGASLPAHVKPATVSSSFRKRFVIAAQGKPMFMFTLKMSWTGVSRSLLEMRQCGNQDEHPPLFTVSCDCLEPQDYLDSCGGECSCLVVSLMLKMLDFSTVVAQSAPLAYVPASRTVH